MRTLDELGISPAPWEAETFANGHYAYITARSVNGNKKIVGSEHSTADAHLIAAAPMLYEALHEIMTCWGSGAYDDGGMSCRKEDTSQCKECSQKGCPIYRKAMDALAAAGGESEGGEAK